MSGSIRPAFRCDRTIRMTSQLSCTILAPRMALLRVRSCCGIWQQRSLSGWVLQHADTPLSSRSLRGWMPVSTIRRSTVIAVSAGAQSVLDEPVVRPEAALLSGPVIVLPTEMPGIRIRNVDIEAGGEMPDVSAIARMLVAEAAADPTRISPHGAGGVAG